MKKKLYLTPEAEVFYFIPEGVICNSLDGDGGDLTIDDPFNPWASIAPDKFLL